MTECANIEMRELLPDLLHEELSAGRRAQVEAHLATCEPCTEELALLRDAQRVLRATPVPRIDTAAIVAALPKPAVTARTAPAVVAADGRSRMAWRIAAAISMISLGGLSFAVVRGRNPSLPVYDTLAAVTPSGATAPVQPPAETTVAVATPSETPAAATRSTNAGGLSAAGGVSDLKDAELEALLGDLDRLEAAPVAEPEPLTGSRLVSGATTGTGTEE